MTRPATHTNRAVLIRLKDPAALARSQGAAASFAQALAPATIEARVYGALVDKLKDALESERVEADIEVVEPSAFKIADNAYIGSDIALFAGGAGIVGLIYWLYQRGKQK